MSHTKESLSYLQDAELDDIYVKLCGYAPINDDGISRQECIDLILSLQDELREQGIIQHSFFIGIANRYILPDKTTVFIYNHEDRKLLNAWYTGEIIEDVDKFLNECANGEHDTLGSGFTDTHANVMEQLRKYLQPVQPLAPVSHTAGPWKADKWATGFTVSSPNEHYSICHLEGCNNAEANARLISCAPELLEALERLVDFRTNVLADQSTHGKSVADAVNSDFDLAVSIINKARNHA